MFSKIRPSLPVDVIFITLFNTTVFPSRFSGILSFQILTVALAQVSSCSVKFVLYQYGFVVVSDTWEIIVDKHIFSSLKVMFYVSNNIMVIMIINGKILNFGLFLSFFVLFNDIVIYSGFSM